MMRKYHVRFGGGRLEKEPKRHLVSRLPYRELCRAENARQFQRDNSKEKNLNGSPD